MFDILGMSTNEYLPIHQTEVIKANLNPSWQPFNLPVSSLCNADPLRPIRIECFDWDVGSNDFIGQCEVTLEELRTQGIY